MSIKVQCNLCGADHYTVVYDTPQVRIVKCNKCGLIYTNPCPDHGAVQMDYQAITDEFKAYQAAGLRQSANFILNHLKKLEKKGKVLNIGYATEIFLDQARQQGWEVYGIELSKTTQDQLKALEYPANFFDAVIFQDMIEHLTSPKETLEEIRRVLKASGIMYCNTPDVDSLASKVFGSKWWGINQYHLFYFNKQTLGDLFNATGFFPLTMRSHARSFTLGYWARKIAAYKPGFEPLRQWLEKNPAWASKLLCIDIGDQIEIFARKSRQLKYLHELELPPETEKQGQPMKVCVVLPAYNAAST
jgi:ubiquinone/menaquinone biosynthesis C-methylase UbiE/ribosomal protein S27E